MCEMKEMNLFQNVDMGTNSLKEIFFLNSKKEKKPTQVKRHVMWKKKKKKQFLKNSEQGNINSRSFENLKWCVTGCYTSNYRRELSNG